jgi:POTRA domain, FtsQ-type
VKEQVITPRNTARSGATRSKSAATGAQRPIRRERTVASRQPASAVGRLHKVLGWIPRAVKVVLAVAIGVLVFAGYRAAASASFFQIHTIDVSGASKTSPDQVKAIVRRLGGSTGVWRANLDQMSKELGQLTWVRSAVVSRVLPDGVRVRITERIPRAVVHLATGRFIWVDEDAAALGEVQPSDRIPDFFLRGWNEGESADVRSENRERVQRFLEIERDFSGGGFSNRISEVDLADLSDVRTQLSGDDADIAVRLGKEDFANHLRGALKRLDEAKSEDTGLRIIYVDNSLGTRVTLGTDRQIVKAAVDHAQSVASVKPPADNASQLTAARGHMKAFSSTKITTRSNTATPGAVAKKNQSAAHVSRGKPKPGATRP